MFYHVKSQPCYSKQELQEIEADPFGGYGFASNLQTSYDHLPIVFPGYPLAAYERPQNLARNDDGSNFAEAEFDIEQHRSPSTPPFYSKADFDWLHEADIQPPYDLGEKQIWGLPELGFYLQVAADGESDTTSSGPSSPSIPGDYYPGVIVSQPQPPHEASFNSPNLGPYQSTPGSFFNTNWGTQESSRYHTEDGSPSIPRDTPLTQLLAGRDSNFTPNYLTTHSNYQPLQNYRCAQQREQQDIKPLECRRSSTCEECDTLFKRPGDLQRHHETAKVHGPAKGPLCPIGGCKYPNKRFARVENFKAHLVKVHKLCATKAAQHVQRWREKGRHGRCSLKDVGQGSNN